MTATLQRDASYHSLTDLGEKQAAVYRVIAERGPISNRAIAEALGWDVNRVTPRVFELRERGLVVEAGVTFDAETGRNVTLWGIIPQMRDESHRNDSDCPANLVILSGNGPLTPSNDPTPANDTKTALEASQALSGDLPQKWVTEYGRRLVEADRAAKEAGMTGYWVGLYRLVAIATTPQELKYASDVIARYKVAKYPEYQIVKALGEQKKRELCQNQN